MDRISLTTAKAVNQTVANLVQVGLQQGKRGIQSGQFHPRQPSRFHQGHSHRNQNGSHRYHCIAAGVVAGATLAMTHSREEDEMGMSESAACCGIVGCIGIDNSYDILANGITILQNRGYDSAGIATVDDEGTLTVNKVASVDGTGGKQDEFYVDAIEAVKSKRDEHKRSVMGLAHTRWATHGGKTDINAHPHCDASGNIVLVHNGTINNYRVLQSWLEKEGTYSKSETDTEVIVNVLGKFCNDNGDNFEDAFRRTISRLRGTWGIVCFHRARPDVLMVSRHGSPLLIGRCVNNGVIVASEQSALHGHVDSYVEMDENETLVLSADGSSESLDSKVIHQISCNSIFLSPAPFKYWTEREIQEQPISINNALSNGSRLLEDRVVLGGFNNEVDKLLRIDQLTLLGCGTSYHSGEFGATLFRKMKIFTMCRAEDASEFVTSEQIPPHSDISTQGACLLSQSGETLDCMLVANELADAGITLFSVINVVGSALARKTNLGVYINAGREVAVASTKAFMCQNVILCLIACWFHERKPNTAPKVEERRAVIQSLHSLQANVESVLKSTLDQVKAFATQIVNNRSMFILGKGLGYPVALEGALKIKEISYLHAEGFGGGCLKHGPFALLSPEERTPVVLLIFDDENKEFMLNAAEQVKARGSRIAIITDLPVCDLAHITDTIWAVPNMGLITPLLAVLPMQTLAFELSLMRGYNPDKPRGLAKTVTVW